MNLYHVNKRDNVKHGRNHLINGHWGIPLTDVRGPITNENGPQGTLQNPQSVNKCVDVEHSWIHPIKSQ